jgi:signal transduction histidine kinase
VSPSSVPPAGPILPDPGDDPDDLTRVVDLLVEVTAILRAGGRETRRLATQSRRTELALRRALERTGPASPPSAALAEWRHDLRARTGTIVSWAQFYDRQRDEATRIQTLEVIERNLKLLADLIAHPPA